MKPWIIYIWKDKETYFSISTALGDKYGLCGDNEKKLIEAHNNSLSILKETNKKDIPPKEFFRIKKHKFPVEKITKEKYTELCK